jgi:hypothetical protein
MPISLASVASHASRGLKPTANRESLFQWTKTFVRSGFSPLRFGNASRIEDLIYKPVAGARFELKVSGMLLLQFVLLA